MFETISLYFLPVIILLIFLVAIVKKVAIYEEFVDGAKEGFTVSVTIIPYLVALIVAISMFRASGAIDLITSNLDTFWATLNVPVDIVPMIFTRSLSGAATLGLFSDLAARCGTESFVTLTAAIMVGSSETTFYVLSVYFGSVGVKKFRYSILAGIIADVIGIALAIWVAHIFFLPNIA